MPVARVSVVRCLLPDRTEQPYVKQDTALCSTGRCLRCLQLHLSQPVVRLVHTIYHTKEWRPLYQHHPNLGVAPQG
jgi:hypothetical protein